VAKLKNDVRTALLRLLRARVVLAGLGILGCSITPDIATQIASIVALGIGVSAVEAYTGHTSLQKKKETTDGDV